VSASSSPQRILIVDDHPDNTESLSLVFSCDDRVVEIVTSGQAAVARALMWQPHLIVLDLGLPDVPGEAVVTALRAAGSPSYIVAYSGYHRREADARAAGCDAFVLKPNVVMLLDRGGRRPEGNGMTDDGCPFDEELLVIRDRVLGTLLRSRLQIERSYEQVAAARRLPALAARRRRMTRATIAHPHLRLVPSHGRGV